MDIDDYPELKEALSEIICVSYDDLQSFNTCMLDLFKREILIEAYKADADVDEVISILDLEEIAKNVLRGISADPDIKKNMLDRIYDIAQLMGPTLRELEQGNNEEDRINE